MPRRLHPAVLIALAALALPACGSKDAGYRLPVHPARGTVTFRGEPLRGAIVRFHPVDPATVRLPDGQDGPPIVLTTETDRDGRFALSTYLADDGVPAGDYLVTVAALPPAAESVEDSDGRPTPPSRKVPAPAKLYRDPATTPLKASVGPDRPDTFTFHVE